MSKSADLYACIYAEEFPAQALLRLRPGLRESPCVVMDGNPPLQEVCCLNTKARLLRMARGMTRVEVESFPDAMILTRCRTSEERTRTILHECAAAFSPRIEDRCEDTSFVCVIDIAGTERLFGTPQRLVRTLWQRVCALGISARIIVSANLHAALCTAKGPLQKPLTVIPPGQERAALASLPVTVLDLTEKQTETFFVWGIRTLGQLAGLPQDALTARMGQDANRLQQLACGSLPHLFQPIEPPFVLKEEMELDTPVELLHSLLFVLGVMLDQMIVRATARLVALASVTVSLVLDGGETHVRMVRTALPSSDKKLWLKLLHLDLDAHPPQAAISSVRLTAEPGSTMRVQLGLFSPQLPEPARLDVTLARIRSIVGEDNVGRPVLLDTHAPERFRMEAFAIGAAETGVHAGLEPRMTMRQLRPPERITVTLQNAQPMWFYFRSVRYTVERAYGPWIESGGWWNSTLWGAEQWDVIASAQNGAMLYGCIVHDRMQNQWQVAALYD